MKNKKKINKRIIIGAGCAAVSVILCFVVAPIIANASSGLVNVVVANEFIRKGDVISPDSLKIVSINKNALPEGYVKEIKDVQLKYASCDIYPMDVITLGKVQTHFNDKNSILSSLGEFTAYSLRLSNLSDYVAGHIETGDVVSIVIDTPSGTGVIPPSLRYVKVITTTSSDGKDKTGSEEGFLPANVTLLLTEDQAVELFSYSETRDISLILRAKSGTESAEVFLSEQYEYLKGELSWEK